MRASCCLTLALLAADAFAEPLSVNYTPRLEAPEIHSLLGTMATVTVGGWQGITKDSLDAQRAQCAKSDSAYCQGLDIGSASQKRIAVGIDLPTQKRDQLDGMLEGCRLVADPSAALTEKITKGMCRTSKGLAPVLPRPRYITHQYFTPEQWRERSRRTVTITAEYPLCEVLEEQEGCTFTALDDNCAVMTLNRKCIQWHNEYTCQEREKRWLCPTPSDDQALEEVSSGAGNLSGSLATVVAALEAARQAGTYLPGKGDPATLNIFSGVRSECRSKIYWGLGDCCKDGSPDQSTHNRAALANLGIGLAIRGVQSVGSRHARDLLFVNTDLDKSIRGLGAGLDGFTGAFSPAVSFYGVEVALADGALSFGFDPASFAVAIAIAVIANLLECDQKEKILSIRRGNGLCEHVAKWCSKRRFFFCKERRKAYCCYNSRLAKTIAGAAKQQLGQSADHCGGFSVKQIEQVDFAKIDLAPVLEEMAGYRPNVDALLGKYQAENAAQVLTMTVTTESE